MSLCGNGCRDCGTNLEDPQKLVQFSPEAIAQAVQTIASSMVEKSDNEFLVRQRSIMRCDGSVLLHISDDPLPLRPGEAKRDAVSHTFCQLTYLLLDYREACRERAKKEKEQTYQSFSMQNIGAIINAFLHDIIEKEKTPSYKDCMWRFKEALEVYICYDTYWDNSLKDQGRE